MELKHQNSAAENNEDITTADIDVVEIKLTNHKFAE
jgi:hypothetical protein